MGYSISIPIDPQRRVFLGRATAWSFLGLGAGVTAWGTSLALRGPMVKHVDVPVNDLHPDLEGFKIAQISDLHIGPTILSEYVQSVVERVNALDADMIAATGDMVDGIVEHLRMHAESLAGLKARHGVFYVTGNHEYYWGGQAWVDEFQRLGMRFLLNENQILRQGSAKLLVGGVPDFRGEGFIESHRHDPKAAARCADTVDFRLLLAHRPQSCYEAEKAGFDLMLSGHTHAGQFYPWAFFVAWAHPYYKGLNLHAKKLWVYVNAGTGYWGPPNRFGVPSEITLLTLRRAQS